MDGWTTGKKRCLALLCGLSGAALYETPRLRAELLTPAFEPVASLVRPRGEAQDAAASKRGLLLAAGQSHPARQRGDAAPPARTERLDALRAELSRTALLIGMTLIGGHAVRDATTPTDSPTTPATGTPSTPGSPNTSPTGSGLDVPPVPEPLPGSQTPPPGSPGTPVPGAPPPVGSGGGPFDPGPPPPMTGQAPEPASLLLGLLGAVPAAAAYRRRRRHAMNP